MKTVAALINASSSRMFLDGVAQFQKAHGQILQVAVHYVHEVEEGRSDTEAIRVGLSGADLVLLDVRGSGKAVDLAARALGHVSNTVILLVGGAPEVLSLVRMGSFSLKDVMQRRTAGSAKSEPNVQLIQNLMRWTERLGDVLPLGMLRHARNWAKAMRYWSAGGTANVTHMLTFLGREYLGLKAGDPPDPQEFPKFGIFDPLSGEILADLAAYRSRRGFDPGLPGVGLLVYGGMHFEQSLAGARAVAEELAEHANLVPVFADTDSTLTAMSRYFLEADAARVRTVVNFRWFQLTTFSGGRGEEALDLLRKLDVPVYCPAPMYGREERIWRDSVQGLSPVETMTAVIMPELDGQIEPLPSIALRESVHAETGLALRAAQALPDQVQTLARRIRKRIALGSTPNQDKRVAFIVYDTPPGEDNIGNASYLDVFGSIRAVAQAMAEQGYRIGELPENKEIQNLFISSGAVNNGRWVPRELSVKATQTLSGSEYRDKWSSLSARSPLIDGDDVVQAWGNPPGWIMADQDRIILPVITFGNCILALQPSRGTHSDPESITHDKNLPPHHQYIAFYRWLEEDFQADAVVHVGTHGTLEFLKGKEAGLSAACWPIRLLGSVPHFYIYHCVNASEAMIAKRRGLSTIVNYNSPPFTPSGLYESYTDLELLIAEYQEARLSDPARSERVKERISAMAGELKLARQDVEELQDELALIKRSLIPKGLHLMGAAWTDQETAETLAGWLRLDRGDVPALHRVLAADRGLDYDLLLENPGKSFQGKSGAVWLDELDAAAKSMVAESFAADTAPSGPHQASLAWALEIRARLQAGLEIPNLLHALAGGYTEPGIGGEPGRDPDVLPTGRNSFQFDPRLVPSEAAYERGREIAEATLAEYHRLHDRWPESVAVILWAFETAKTRGETVGQILGYLGIRPVRKNPWKTDLVIIPSQELGRPRIDVTVQICGFFRDMFANVVSLINRAFTLAADQDERPDQNFIKPHTLAAQAELEQRMDARRAAEAARARVFGPRPGEYGTRVTSLIETGAWQSEEDIVRTFTDSMNHLYSDTIHGERFAALYDTRLSSVEMVSQIRDTTDYEIADLDHYYEYFGGLSRSVAAVRGQDPVMLITDTTREKVRTEEVGQALERGIRTRLLNPKWIEAMLEHGVHGAQKISERVQYLVGFAATTHAVKDWVFSAVAQRYLFDREMLRRLAQNNPYAAEEIMRRLKEAADRGYWRATQDELDKIKNAYLEIEGDIEEQLEEN